MSNRYELYLSYFSPSGWRPRCGLSGALAAGSLIRLSKVIGVEGLEAIHGQLGLVSATVHDAERVMAQLADGARVAVGQRACKAVMRAQAQIAQMLPLVRRVMAQTRARVLGGDQHYRDKVFSLFEPHTDEHLTKRDYFVNLPHPLVGVKQHCGIPCKMSATPCAVQSPGPLLGQHTDEVLSEVLGLSESEIATLRDAGALE